ncbi:hypothetical protein [Chromobacterium subtsugae]|uniref:hypothetical protein n=1 Tax=Chromobacterium subtsugae TaxID=251747 RepID=UPI000AAAFF62|nr:hypothetical protein [Chromobacterium subtsugae]
MRKPWETDNCEQIRAHYAYYPIPVAALLWCGVPPDQIQDELNKASQHPNIRGVWVHPYIPCMEPRCRVLHEAIVNGHLPCSRENGQTTDDHVKPERRHVKREDLKAWIAEQFPTDKPAFLFDDIERDTHTAISAESYRVLKTAHDAKEQKLSAANERIRELNEAVTKAERERDVYKGAAEHMESQIKDLGTKEETTYLNIIGGLLFLMLGKSPKGEKLSVYESQAAVISAMLAYHDGKPGIAARTMEDKFAAANRSIKAS